MWDMAAPLVDVIVPVHAPSRPVARAVASVLDHTAAPVRVLVVAHNTPLSGIRDALGDRAGHPAVELLDLQDGIPSPTGPRNLALDRATARYLVFLDSDDALAPGAIDSWIALASDSGAAAVLARIERGEAGAADPLPPTRRGRTRDLHPVRDRLAYRSEPFGLIERERFADLRFTAELQSGEDIEASIRIWCSGARLAYDRHGPAHRVLDDAADRVTATRRSLAADFAFLDALERSDWFPKLSRGERRVFGVKVLRLHFFDAVLARLHADGGLAAHREGFARLVAQIRRMAPGAISLLSRRDRAAIDAVLSGDGDADEVLALLEARWLGGVDSILTRNPLLTLHRQGPRRTLRDMTV